MASASARFVVRRHEQTGLAVDDGFRNAAGARGDDGARGRHRLEHRRAEAFGDRAHREEVERLHQAERVAAEARQEHVPFEPEVA